MNIAMVGKDVMRNWSNVADNVGRGMICGLPFQGSKTRTEDTFSSLNVLLVDWTIVNVIDGEVHEFPTAGMHDDVLHTSCKDSIFVLSFCELFGISCHSQDHGPELGESFILS
jgi:hypothetical protein